MESDQSAGRAARHPFVKTLATALRHRCRVRKPGTRMLIACSGGADSVALLRALHALAAARPWRLTLVVGHVDHGVRADSASDAAFVAELARGLALPCDVARLDPASFTGNTESGMRRGRYEALAAMAAKHDASAVVAGHHADDQLETLLMRLVRGAALRGLSGMRWRRPLDGGVVLLRPMLAVTHEEALVFLRDLGQPWREDSTNADASRWRARLRRDVLPVLRALRPDAAHKAVAAADALTAADRLVRDAAAALREAVAAREGVVSLPRQAARAADPLVLTTLLRELLVEADVPADRLRSRSLAAVARAARDDRGGTRTLRIAGVEVTVTQRSLTIAAASATPGTPHEQADQHPALHRPRTDEDARRHPPGD